MSDPPPADFKPGMMLSLEVSVAKNASCTTKKGLMILKEGHARTCMNVRGSVTGTALSFVDLVFRTGTLRLE